ncbi:MAG: PH domain-containing protein [Corynebacterium sp.]|nr:PH domain-containing protein [Corynebacterium sp.]
MARYNHKYRRGLLVPAEMAYAQAYQDLLLLPGASIEDSVGDDNKPAIELRFKPKFRTGLRKVRLLLQAEGTELRISSPSRSRRYIYAINQVVDSFAPGVIDDQGFTDLRNRIGRVTRFFIRPELRELPNYLNPGERLHFMVPCFYDGNTAVIALTDKRVLAVDMAFGHGRIREIPLKNITSRDSRWGLLTDRVEITARSQRVMVSGMRSGYGRQLLTTLRDLMGGN